ncbi:MAG: PAS domain S-box protein [Magnetospirillum sp.]|nr:PAS domain S-box protein [Magnetospirillum sp.]
MMSPVSHTQLQATEKGRGVILAGAILLVVAFSLAAWITSARSLEQDQRNARITAENLARVLSESIDGSIGLIDSQLILAVTSLQRQRGEPAIPPLARDTQSQSMVANSVRLADANGNVLAGPDVKPDKGGNIADRDFFQALAQSDSAELLIGKPVFSRHTDSWVMPLARRLSNGDGSFAGIVYQAVPLAQISDLFQSIDIGSKGTVVLFDHERRFVTRRPEPNGPGSSIGLKVCSPEFAASFGQSREKGSYQAYSTTDGIRRTYAYREIGARPLFIMVGLAEEDYLADWTHWRAVILAAVAIFTMLVAAAALLIHQAQSRRLRTMQQLAAQSRELQTLVADLTRSKERYRQILRTASDGIHVLDSSGRLIEASDSFYRMLGQTAEDFTCRSVSDWEVSHSATALAQELLPSLMAAPAVFETIHRRRDGSEMNVEINAQPVILDGQAYIYASSRDITERKTAETRLRQVASDLSIASARLRLVLDTAAEGIFGIDDETRITFANQAAASILGWSETGTFMTRPATDVLGHRLADGESCCHRECSIRLTLQDGQVRRIADEYFVGSSGKPVPVEYVVSPVMVEGHPVGAVVVFHDISERRALEVELKRSNTQLEQFAYVASHDLRQPLRMISSYLSLLERKLGSSLTDDERSFLDFAVGGARRLDALILGLLEYSRIGRDAPHADMDLATAVDDALDNLKLLIADTGASITVAPNLPRIAGNRLELMRLFQNLIGNALKYRFPDRPPVIAVECRGQDHEWIITVADNGIGIAEEDRARVFGIFQRLVTANQYEGTGIGLAICQKIVEGHAGRIWVEGNDGEGSRFMIALPALDGQTECLCHDRDS